MKDIPGYEGKYAVSKEGHVWSHKRGRLLSLKRSNLGYLHVCLNGKEKLIHRLVALTHIQLPDDPKKKEVNHKNGVKNDNRVENLEWIDHRSNIIHARDVLKRESLKCQLNPSQIGLILCLSKTGDFRRKHIAAYLGSGRNQIHRLLRDAGYE